MDIAYQKQTYLNYALCWSGGIGGESIAECVVPDSMPDVGAIVDCDAILSIRSKETESGRIRAATELSAHILYQPEDGGALRSLPLTMSCELSASAAELDTNCYCQLRLRLRSLDARVINSRKLSLHAEISGQAACYRRQELTLVHSVSSALLSLQTQTKSADICMLSDLREKTFVITAEQALPIGCEASESILLQRVRLLHDSSEFVGEKLVFRGRAQVFLLLSAENEPQICSFECEFSQVMELEGDNEPSPSLSLLLTGAYFDLPEHGSGKISCELHILAQAAARKEVELNYIADIYSNQIQLEPIRNTERFIACVREYESEHTLCQRCEWPTDAKKLLYLHPLISSISAEGESFAVSLSVKAVYLRNDGTFGCTNLRLKEKLALNTEEGENAIQFSAMPGEAILSIGGDGAELRMPLQLQLTLSKTLELSHVAAVSDSAEPWPPMASLTLLRATGSDELWSLAKEHRSTCEAIRAANKGRGEAFLLVPRER